MNPFKRFRIDYLLFGGFAAFIIVLLFVTTWMNYALTSREAAQRTSMYQLELLNELTNRLQIQIESVEQTSLTITRNIENFNYLKEDDDYSRLRQQTYLDSTLKEFIYSNAIIHSMELYTNGMKFPPFQGKVSYDSLDNLPQNTWFDAIQDRDFGWIKEHTIDANGGSMEVISLFRKMYSGAGEYYGLLILNIKANALRELIQGRTSERSLAVIDGNGNILTSVGTSFVHRDWINEMPEASGSRRFTSASDEEVFVSWSRWPTRQWLLVEATPWDEITRTGAESARWMLLVGAVAVVAALGFTLLFSRQFLKPIYYMIRFMDRYQPDLKVRMPTDYSNEFDHLFRGYQRLINRIDELYESLKKRYKLQREAEIKALQAMINPHFLYNTLDQVNWIAIKSGQSTISHVLSLMGKMFRIGLSNGRSFITIGEELQHIQLYLEIQQIRWKGKLTYAIQVPDGAHEYWIPKLTLQPFVENAIIHGFHDRPSGHLSIEMRQEQQDFVVILSDDGNGVAPGWDAPKRDKGGYGVHNVKQRLQALFGDSYGVQIGANPGGGTQVRVRFPVLNDTSPYEEGETDEADRDYR